MILKTFPSEVHPLLKNYVYRLIDPRNGETFYVGKGSGNRVFDHTDGKLKEDCLNDKITRIREIQSSGLEVSHVIHRHGMDSATALEVEAALIDAYPGLTNQIDGHGSGDTGAMHAREIITQYSAETLRFHHKAIIINVNKSALEHSLYDAVRYAWRLNKQNAESAEIVLASVQGLIRGVFVPSKWIAATPKNFPLREGHPNRYGFIGVEAPTEIAKLYIHKRLPESFRKKGASNPIRYSW